VPFHIKGKRSQFNNEYIALSGTQFWDKIELVLNDFRRHDNVSKDINCLTLTQV
jgi:hypothetical protein